jgi:hypothetical protein
MAINDRADQTVRRYVRGDQPADIQSTEDLLKWVIEELDRIQEASSEFADSAPQIAETEPSSKRTGMIRYARAPWDPLGTGYEGYVVYDGSVDQWKQAFVSGSITAADVAFVPAGTLAATDVQEALEELDSETQAALALKADKATVITAGVGLTGDHDLSGDFTINLSVASLATEASTADADEIAINSVAGGGTRSIEVGTLKTHFSTAFDASYLKLDGSNKMSAEVQFTQLNSTPAAVEITSIDPFIYDTTPSAESGGVEIVTKTGGSDTVIAEFSDFSYFFGQFPVNCNWSSNGASEGPYLSINRSRTDTEAANNLLGVLRYGGEDDAGNFTVYGSIGVRVDDPTNGSEDGSLLFYQRRAGTVTKEVEIGAGMTVGNPTDGQKGAGTLNVENGIYIDGTAVSASGKIVQIASTQTGTSNTGTTTIPFDNTVPQNTEGTEFMSVTLTPTNASNKLRIEVTILLASSAGGHLTAALFQDSTANALAAAGTRVDNTSSMYPITFSHTMDAGTTSSTTFKVRAGNGAAATVTLNGTGGTQIYGGVACSSMTVTEYEP